MYSKWLSNLGRNLVIREVGRSFDGKSYCFLLLLIMHKYVYKCDIRISKINNYIKNKEIH